MASTPVNGLPQGFTLDPPPQPQAGQAQGGDLPAGFALDPAPAAQQPPGRQVAAGQGAIGPGQVAAGGGAIGPSAVMGGVGDLLHSGLVKMGLSETPGPTAGWPQAPGEPDPLDWLTGMAKRAMNLPEQLQPKAEEHLKNFLAIVAGIKREPAQASTPTPTAKPTTQKQPTAEATPIWQAFPGDRGVSQLADHVIKMEGDSKAARDNNNPGNLKDPKTGEFRKFDSYERGRSALVRQLNRWRDTNPDWTISDFNAVYAPDKSHGGDNPDGTEESRNRYLMNQIAGNRT